jgi:DNA-binding HxlR family transcriptional regulator
VPEYNQYCPIARGAEIFAERWTPLVIRNLMLGCHSFNAIADGVPRMSRTLLTRRLRELNRMGVVEMRPNPAGRGHLYFLTPAGQELKEVTMALGTWGARWIELGPADYDAGVVLWTICRLASPESLPRQRRTVRFELIGRKRERYWVVFQRPEAEVCLKPPGFDEDLVVTTTAEWLTKWHAGLISWQEALRRDLIRLEGVPAVAHALPRWAPLSAFARVRPVAAIPT